MPYPYLIVGLIGGTISAAIASSKGRNAVGWFVFGFLTPLVAIIVALVVSNLKEEKARHARSLAERRRLREELKMQKLRAQRFESLASRRLDIHDRALGVETGPEGAPPEPLPRGSATAARLSGSGAATWYYAPEGRDPVGPLTFEQLAGAGRTGEFGRLDLVWRTGWKDWRPAREVAELEDVLGA